MYGKEKKILLLKEHILKLEEVRAYIMQNFCKQLTISDLTRIYNSSSSTLQRHFKYHFKVSISYFITRCRMHRAKELLTRHECPVGQVGMVVGYQHRSSFTHAFSKFFGHSPAFYFREVQ